MLTESAKKLRDPLAFGLLGATAVYLIALLCVLLNGDLAGKFANRAAMTQGEFVNPVLVVVIVAAVLLVAAVGEPSPMARVVVPVALGALGVMLLLGLITLFAGFGVDLAGGPNAVLQIGGFAGITGAGKVVGTFAMLAMLAVVGIGAFLTFTIFQGLPAPVRPQQQQQQWGGQQQWGQPQQQWGGQPQQQQWGGQPQQQQWGQPQQQQWGAAGAGAAGGAAAGQAWGQPTSGESSAGYAAGSEAGQQPPTSGESSTGYAAGGDAGQQPPPQQQWGQPPAAEPTQQWGQPEQGEAPQEGEDDRPGWWSPSS